MPIVRLTRTDTRFRTILALRRRDITPRPLTLVKNLMTIPGGLTERMLTRRTFYPRVRIFGMPLRRTTRDTRIRTTRVRIATTRTRPGLMPLIRIDITRPVPMPLTTRHTMLIRI